MTCGSRCARQLPALVGLLVCGACAPTTHGFDGFAQDYVVPRDFAQDPCQDPPGDVIMSNPGFEAVAMATVLNTAGGNAGALEPWRGCCGGAVTSTWQVGTMTPHCGQRSLSLQSSVGASANVLFQNLALSGATPGQTFIATAYVNITAASSAALLIDVQDAGVSPSVTIAQSTTLTQVTAGWVQLSASGALPTRAGTPAVQFRFNNSGTLNAFLDDAAMTLK